MNTEKEYDSSTNDYIVVSEPDEKYIKQLYWDMAIGLQEVDNLKPSKYLKSLLKSNVNGTMTISEVKEKLNEYYSIQKEENKVDNDELECDFVSARIVELLKKHDFELSVNYLKYVHKFLFQDVYEFAGEFRKVDILKNEKILNNDSVSYGDCKKIEKLLEYDISTEKEKNYESMNIVDIIKNIVNFTSDIWQVHPFREGNTRTTAVFIELYLNSLGYDVNNVMFKRKSIYFRNALVRSNYYNDYLNVKEDKSYLTRFYENLLLGKNNNLSSENLIVKELF